MVSLWPLIPKKFRFKICNSCLVQYQSYPFPFTLVIPQKSDKKLVSGPFVASHFYFKSQSKTTSIPVFSLLLKLLYGNKENVCFRPLFPGTNGCFRSLFDLLFYNPKNQYQPSFWWFRTLLWNVLKIKQLIIKWSHENQVSTDDAIFFM